MKKLFILLIMMACVIQLSAQDDEIIKPQKRTLKKAPEITRSKVFELHKNSNKSSILFVEDFESTTHSWTYSGCWQIGEPTSSSGYGFNSSTCANTNLSGNYPDNEDAWLTSPPISLPLSCDEIFFSFSEWIELESGYDYGKIKISSDGGSNWATLFKSNGSSDWRNTILNITSYKGKTILLGFNLVSDGSYVFNGWHIDDIQIESILSEPLEVNITSLNSQNFPLIYMNVAVDTFGVGMPSLSQSNFSVYENAVLQTDLFEVTPPAQGGGQRLADIIFLMDNSGSMGGEQSAIYNNMVFFIDQLIQTDIDYALGLCRFGQNSGNGNPILEDNGILTTRALYFRDNVWLRNIASGGVEPGYYAITQSTAGFTFRPGAQKIFIILTDETPDQGGATQQEAINACISGSITLYALTNQASSQLNTVATQTNGRFYNITDPFNDILEDISGGISNSYVVRYNSNDMNCNGLTRTVDVIVDYDGNQAIDSHEYMPCEAPTVQRTAPTVALHNQAWIVGTEFTIEVEVTDNFEPYVNVVNLFYKNTANTFYSMVSMMNTTGNIWSCVIPGDDVLIPGVDYFITAADGLVTVSDPPVEPAINPYQLAILPNLSPVIIHTPIQCMTIGQSVEITANMSDNTNSLVSQKLFYRKRGQILYQETEMVNISGSFFSETIPSEFITIDGTDYYISAWDNFGVRTDHGSVAFPHQINPFPEIICRNDTTVNTNQPPFNLQGSTPLGGIYSGTGVSANIFDPSSADIGTHEINYSYTTPFGCENNCTFFITVTNENDLYPPRNLTGVADYNHVTLRWEFPGPENGGWMHYDNGYPFLRIGFNSITQYEVAAKWAVADLGLYAGKTISKVLIYVSQANHADYYLRIATGEDAANLVVEQPLTNPVDDAWNEVILSTPFEISGSEPLYIGYFCQNTQAGYSPLSMDDGEGIMGKGDLVRYGTEWRSMGQDYGGTFRHNWNIQAWVDGLTDADDVMLNHQINKETTCKPESLLPLNAPIPNFEFIENASTSKDVPLYYKIYHNLNCIDSTESLKYIHTNAIQFYNYYHVTAMYPEGESSFSNQILINTSFPELVANPESFAIYIEENGQQNRTVTLSNSGSATADYDIVAYDGNRKIAPKPISDVTDPEYFSKPDNPETIKDNQRFSYWDLLFNYNLTQTTGYSANLGIVSDGTFFYVTQFNNATILKLNIFGNLIETFTIPGVTSLYELTWDGTYFYGGKGSHTIYKMDFNSKTLVGTITAPVNVSNITYDPNDDAFWVNTEGEALRQINRSGSILSSITPPEPLMGLAYDDFSAGGPYLWVFTGRDASTWECEVQKINIATGITSVLSHEISSDLGLTIAGGLFISSDIMPDKIIIGGLAQGLNGDILFGYDMMINAPDWISFNKTSGTVSELLPDQFELTASSTGLPEGNYSCDVLIVSNDPVNPVKTIPVNIFVGMISDHINLYQGWNLISFDVFLDPDIPVEVFSPENLTSTLQMVTGFQNQQGVYYDPNGPGFMNTLTQLQSGEGYWVKVIDAGTLTVEGNPIPEDFEIDLMTGWNLIGYWLQETQIPEDAFAELIDAGVLEMVTSYENGGHYFDPNGPGFMNTLTEIKNGFGYWVKVNADYNAFSYPEVLWECGMSITDNRDGQTYQTVQIGTQCWMAENLNVGTMINGSNNQTNNGTIEKYCYDNSTSNCDTYGGLYQWDEMMQYTNTKGVKGICTTGWHLPTEGEWAALTTYVSNQPAYLCNSNSTYIAKALAATTNWNTNSETCTVGNNLITNNATGFTALPAGDRSFYGSFDNLGNYGYWWSSYQGVSTGRGCYLHDSGTSVGGYTSGKSGGFSVRCLQDN